ncbi:unannotated protein [freshwater metagenome]|uniref:Unannotated protein n=1 Tax=freshwater metagenome TaxID=449393 RepID=A0A6J6GRL3_9ZZZZ
MTTTALAAVTPVAQEHRSEYAVSARWIAITRSILRNCFIVNFGDDKEIGIIGVEAMR